MFGVIEREMAGWDLKTVGDNRITGRGIQSFKIKINPSPMFS